MRTKIPYVAGVAAGWLTIIALSGCTMSSFLDMEAFKPPKSTTYKVKTMGGDWIPIKDTLADLAYEHSKAGSTISLNSTCEKYRDTALKHLMYNLLAGMEEQKIIKEKIFMLDGREALSFELTATADGVPVHTEAIVMRKNFCIYDFIYSAEPKRYKKTKDDFDEFVGSFHAD